jgi:hypothetical protein
MGTRASPFATLGHAVAAASTGDTVVLRAGSYHEQVSIFKTLTIENYPGEAVRLDGSSPVQGWTRSGNTWVHTGWAAQFDSSASFARGSDAGGFINPAHPMAAHPDQVFMDGRQLQQVASSPGIGQFCVDYAKQTITLGSDPAGRAIRASDLQRALVIGAYGVTVRGIAVERYATSLWQMGTVYIGGAGGTSLRDMVVADNATEGVALYAPNLTLDHLTVQNNGMTGIQAGKSDNAVIANSLVTGNNREQFNTAPASAGIKVLRLNGITIRNNVVTGNVDANGIWTDENVTNFVIVGNTVGDNGSTRGIMNELSGTGIVANNSIFKTKCGYSAFDSGDVRVFNNTFWQNTLWDVGLTQDNRYQPGKSTASASVQPSAANPWLVRNVLVANNDMSRATGTFQFYALDNQTHRSADSMNITIDGNLFRADLTSTDPRMIGWGGSDNKTVTIYRSVQAFQSAKGATWVNEATTDAHSSGSTDALVSDPSYAVPLPSDVARAIGVQPGVQHVGVF